MKLVTLDPQTVLVDTNDGVVVTMKDVRDACVKHFGMETVEEQIGKKRGGILLSAHFLNFYRMKSVDANIVICSVNPLTPEQTRPLAVDYLASKLAS